MRFLRISAILAGLLVCSQGAWSVGKESKSGGIETKIALQSSFENRLKQILPEIIGTDKVIVIVDVQLASEKKEAQETKKNDDFILPGVPIKEAISEKQVGEAVTAALGEDTRTLISKMTVTIILDKSVSSSVVNVVKQVSTSLLGIDASRGDQLNVQQMYFQKNPFYWGSLLYPPNVYWVILILSAMVLVSSVALFMFGPFKELSKGFITGITGISSAMRDNASSAGDESLLRAVAGADGANEVTVPQNGEFVVEEPFSFVKPSNINSLIYLIKDLPAEKAAIVVNYLKADLASKLLAALPAEKQRGISVFMAKTRELDPTEVDSLESTLKKRIGYLVGGKDKLVQILDNADDTTRAGVVAALDVTDATLAAQVKGSLISLDILASLDVTGLQAVIKACGQASFATVLKATPDDALRTKILAVLPAGAAARVKQEMELSRIASPQRIESEKRRLIDIIRKLEARGIITR